MTDVQTTLPHTSRVTLDFIARGLAQDRAALGMGPEEFELLAPRWIDLAFVETFPATAYAVRCVIAGAHVTHPLILTLN